MGFVTGSNMSHLYHPKLILMVDLESRKKLANYLDLLSVIYIMGSKNGFGVFPYIVYFKIKLTHSLSGVIIII